MRDSLLSLLAFPFILACLGTVIAICASMLYGADRAIRERYSGKRGAARVDGSRRLDSSITTDEIIDLHIALQQITSLRAIAQEVSIG